MSVLKILVNALVCLVVLVACTSICSAETTGIQFTDQEKTFIAEHPVINLAVDPEFVPYEFIDSDGQYKGIAADYIALLSKKTGLKMVVAKNLTWSAAYEQAVEKKLDVLPCVAKTPDREKYFLFSNSYLEFQRVIVVKDTNTTIKSFADLLQTKVAVQINSSHYSYLKTFPQIEISPYPTVEAGLAAVSDGIEQSFVGNLATSSYLIKKGGYTNLKYIVMNANDVQSLHFAVRNDWPVLVGIINKGLASITKEEKIEINNKWIGVENQIDYGPIIVVIGIILLVLLVSVYWVIRLKREVAKRRIIEEQLKKAKNEAEVANQIKSSFLARMSHEIRTPLNAITGMAYLIRKTDINTTQKLYLEKITQASHNMLGIINDILDFSKIESGKIEIERITFSLDKVLQQVISIVSFKIEEQGIHFTMNRDPEIPNNLLGDPKRIEQILINIINNAVKFTAEGEVSLRIRVVSKSENHYVLEFQVTDTGIGMSDEQMAQLFTPFVQADSSINRRFGGTGLGLSIVKSLTDLMSGEINVTSMLEKGSTFTLTLPLEVDRIMENEMKQTSGDFYFQDIKTLIVEKNNANLNLLQIYLKSFGMTATLCVTMSEAMELLTEDKTGQTKAYDLLVLDYETMDDDSFAFAEKIRRNPSISTQPKIILLIPFMREDIFEAIEEVDVDLGVVKPVIPSVLYNGILEIFRKETLELQAQKSQSAERDKITLKNVGDVLVVEDNKTNQFIAKSILEGVGFKVVLTDNGEEGVAYFAAHQTEISLILMDLHMPVLNGYEASLQIRQMNQEIPIVAMTADAITGVEEECKKAGIHYYISKPFDPENLIKTLFDILKPEKGEPEPKPASDRADGADGLTVLDEADGLRRLGNDNNMYQVVLEEYLEENRNVSKELNQALKQHDYKEAIRIVHKNKSGSGNIGAIKLYRTASALQNALENGLDADIDRLSQLFNELLVHLLREIEQRK